MSKVSDVVKAVGGNDMSEASCNTHELVADVTLLAEGKVLMVKYKDTRKYDNQEGWFLPDDFLLHLEHPNDGAKRIIREQSGLMIDAVSLSHIESFENNGAWHLIFHLVAKLDGAPDIATLENIAAIEWFAVNQLPGAADVAHHGWALSTLGRVLGRESR
jgi:ADP-ribose pyrophosphatase YjhB (NUDIX family)